MSRFSKRRFKVETKNAKQPRSDQIHVSKFVPARSGGGLIAEIRVDGRPVFPTRPGLQPKNDGKPWRFKIVAENPKRTVYFAQILPDNAKEEPIKIVIQPDGKIVCINRKPVLMRADKKRKAKKNVPFANYRSATPTMLLAQQADNRMMPDYERFPDDERRCRCGDEGCDQRDCDDSTGGPFEEPDDDRGGPFEEAIGPIYDCLPKRPVNCFACGFEDCRCDGTASDWVPARTTLNLLG